MRYFRLVYFLLFTLFILLLIYYSLKLNLSTFNFFTTNNNIDFTNANNITGFPNLIIPNIIHFFKFRNHTITFTEMICILAAWCHQKPDKILIHCDCTDLQGPYWPQIKTLQGLEIHQMQQPRNVFGRPLSSVYHAGDIARLLVLSNYGGIALDLDTYVVKSLDEFRHFEFSVGWPLGMNLGCQVLISHKNSRFLKMWIESYKLYRPELWYYNAGELPTRILEESPFLVHRVPEKFGISLNTDLLYKLQWNRWREYYSIHLLIRHRSYLDQGSMIKEFDEENIKSYPYTFGKMARVVLFGSEEKVSNLSSFWRLENCRN